MTLFDTDRLGINLMRPKKFTLAKKNRDEFLMREKIAFQAQSQL